ncbi:MAG TPA: MBL fold metallo-hydrolase [Segeticoccus sp.]|uniref:MBL fold metallo-hydrolase n=1 Tax=Segeticoccus sp. TaxID=2706531 RepID=UPI002D801C7E|nr:MBL fold metallo-hydrolase [Segeticoccus sp.]HET8599330.1 MBL fold metallo-hydrolase [Segeticoccus sp.]
MSYTGDVQPGGASDVRELPGLTVRKASVSSMDNNVYLLTCTATGRQLLVDAADDAPRVARLVAEGGEGLDTVVTTHQHWDHHRALQQVVSATGAHTAAGAPDADELPVPPDQRLEQGDEVRFGDVRLAVVRLTGHTPGSIALAWTEPGGRAHLWTGDSLFPGGPGKTWSAADFRQLMDDLEQRVFGVYGDDTWVYPGHGKDTTLGAERPHLAEWRDRGW